MCVYGDGLGEEPKLGRNIALIILAVNLVGDSVNAWVRHDLRVLIFYLLRTRAVKPGNG